MATASDKFYILSKYNSNIISFEKISTKTFSPIVIKIIRYGGEETELVQTTISSTYYITLNSYETIEVWSDNVSLEGMHILATKNIDIGGNIMSLVAGAGYDTADSFAANSSANFKEIFKNNTLLVDASDLYIPPELLLKTSCFEGMFEGCTGLLTPPELTPEILSTKCYKNMFKGCTHLVEAPTCRAITTARQCFENMFYGCTSLIEVMHMDSRFSGFYVSSTDNPRDYGYEMCGMYRGCTSLTIGYGQLTYGYTVGCYQELYYECTSLTTPDDFIDSTPIRTNINDKNTLKSYCCKSMYQSSGVESIKIPAVPIELSERTFGNGAFGMEEIVTRVSTNLFENMYKSCKGLRSITSLTLENIMPHLPDEPVTYFYNGENLFIGMFADCTNITSINLRLGVLNKCTAILMFLGCSKITSINLTIHGVYNYQNALNKTIYASNCCESMFENCTDLRTINAGDFSFPEVTKSIIDNKTILRGGVSANFCLKMFKGCTNLQTVNMTIPFANNSDSTEIFGDGACELMFEGCTNLTNINNISFTNYLGSNSLKSMFKNCTKLENINSTEIELYFKGSNVCSNMFEGCTKLKNVSKLKIKNLTNNCCESMFSNCTSLQKPPTGFFSIHKYPSKCYKNMFSGCTSLQTIPNIYGDTPANTLIDEHNKKIIPYFYDECFAHMFDGCTNLEVDFNGICGKFKNSSCAYMFNNCRRLKSVRMIKPLLSIDDSDMESCFSHMFAGCSSLNILPPENDLDPDADAKKRVPVIDISEAGKHNADLPSPMIGKILGERVFENMFLDCISLTEEPIIYTGDNNSILAVREYGYRCFAYMYSGCNKMKATIHIFENRVPEDVETGQKDPNDDNAEYEVIRMIKGNKFGEECFYYMYSGCSKLTRSLSIIGMGDGSSLGKSACERMYNACTSLTDAPNINVYNIADNGLLYMCINCTHLSTLLWTSGITADTVGEYALKGAFKSCTALREMVPLYIKNYSAHACEEAFMQSGVQSLGTSLSTARTADKYSFYKMFESCTSLESLATSIIPGVYINYLEVTQATLTDLTGIETKPKYTYTINGIDYNYFYGSLSDDTVRHYYIADDIKIGETIIQVPPKLVLKEYTFSRMFYGCTYLTTPPTKMNNLFYGYYSCYKMFANTKLQSLPELTPVKYENMYEPGMKDDDWCVNVIGNSPAGSSTVYATTPTGKYIYKRTDSPLIEALAEGAFCAMFMNTAVTSLPNLYAKKFNKNAANSMFRNCQKLGLILSVHFTINEVADYAFSHMFDNCKNLKFAATQEMGFEATKLFKNLSHIGKYCFCGMFMNCNSLDKLILFPENLTFADGACSCMYMNCSSLEGRVEYDFSGNTLAPNCFMNMFRNCSQITVVIIKLGSITDIKRSCCENMFMSCYSLIHAKLEVSLVSKEALDKATTSQTTDTNTKYAFCHMFYDCTGLNDFWTNLYIPWSFDLTLEWLAGVSETGTYHYNNILDTEKMVRDTSSIPQGWVLAVGYDVKGEGNSGE